MTVVAMWCRHEGDNVIGVEKEIPWRVESDAKHFLDVVKGRTVVCGRKTYETFDNRTLEGCKIFVFTKDATYETVDKEHHFAVLSQKELAGLVDEEEELYVAGGACVYDLFMTGKERFKPQIVVDCVYGGKMRDLAGERAEISKSVAVMQKGYRRITPFYRQDGVSSAVYIKKGEFVAQSVLKRIVEILEKGAETY